MENNKSERNWNGSEGEKRRKYESCMKKTIKQINHLWKEDKEIYCGNYLELSDFSKCHNKCVVLH